MKIKYFFFAISLLLFFTAASPVFAVDMTQGECEQYTQLRCETKCGTSATGQQCYANMSYNCTQFRNINDEENAVMDSIELEVNSYYTSNQPQCDVDSGAKLFATEAECYTYCGTFCTSFCRGDAQNCAAECKVSDCENGGWETHTDNSNFLTFAESWMLPNDACRGTSSTTGGATVGEGTTATAQLDNPIAASSVMEIVINVIQVLLTLLGSAALLVFIYGGIMLITSAGNEEKVKKARSTLVWAILGLVIILVSYGVMSFVFGLFTGGGGE
ncbi:pilin [Patescibacteria group bacterium]|nr:pilin [Patescibacteria group bacterium]MBU1672934.1 pilin [Patescibacteria group bacterium]MBU1963352.1 pilin [Patescibacteria group bacterium]